MTDVQRDLGRMESQIETMCSKLDKLEREIETISNTLAEARGGWRTLMWVSGASAAIGGMVAKFAPWLTVGPR
jgi:chromosome condensin MukBEF ATPase and DNA-binding subunit MukB